MDDILQMMFALESYGTQPDDPYFVDSESYCLEHAKAELEKRPELDLEGGYCGEEDHCLHCETCGKLLAYTLTESGVGVEIDHFRTVQFRSPLSRDDAAHVARMLCAAQSDPDAIRIAKRAFAKIPADAINDQLTFRG